jgi:hypothetical protein
VGCDIAGIDADSQIEKDCDQTAALQAHPDDHDQAAWQIPARAITAVDQRLAWVLFAVFVDCTGNAVLREPSLQKMQAVV